MTLNVSVTYMGDQPVVVACRRCCSGGRPIMSGSDGPVMSMSSSPVCVRVENSATEAEVGLTDAHVRLRHSRPTRAQH